MRAIRPVLGFIAAGSPLEPLLQIPLAIISMWPLQWYLPAATISEGERALHDDGILDRDFVVIEHQQEATGIIGGSSP